MAERIFAAHAQVFPSGSNANIVEASVIDSLCSISHRHPSEPLILHIIDGGSGKFSPRVTEDTRLVKQSHALLLLYSQRVAVSVHKSIEGRIVRNQRGLVQLNC